MTAELRYPERGVPVMRLVRLTEECDSTCVRMFEPLHSPWCSTNASNLHVMAISPEG